MAPKRGYVKDLKLKLKGKKQREWGLVEFAN